MDTGPGRGTTFTIYFPRAGADEAPAVATPRPAALDGTETILVTEDQPEVRSIATAVLARHGYTVLVAESGEEALGILARHRSPIHLLLTDVVMPSMGGQVLAGRLHSTHRDTRVLYMSGYTDDAIVRHGVLKPGVEFIQKPFTPEGLLRKIRDVLDKPQSASTPGDGLD